MTKRVIRAVGWGAVVVTGLVLASCGKDRNEVVREKTLASEKIAAIGVNAYLWQATLNTLDFMPLAQADTTSGVIISDWRTDPADPGRRVKVTVYIQDKALRANALKVNVFQQELRSGQWADIPATVESEQAVEDAILIEARRLRMQQMPGEK